MSGTRKGALIFTQSSKTLHAEKADAGMVHVGMVDEGSIDTKSSYKYTESGILLNAILHHTDGLMGLGVVRRSTPIDADLYIANGSEKLKARQIPIVRQDAGAAAGISHEEKQALRRAAKARGNTTKTDKSTDK